MNLQEREACYSRRYGRRPVVPTDKPSFQSDLLFMARSGSPKEANREYKEVDKGRSLKNRT